MSDDSSPVGHNHNQVHVRPSSATYEVSMMNVRMRDPIVPRHLSARDTLSGQHPHVLERITRDNAQVRTFDVTNAYEQVDYEPYSDSDTTCNSLPSVIRRDVQRQYESSEASTPIAER